MSETFPIPVAGAIPSLEFSILEPVYSAPYLLVRSFVPYKRFAIQVVDDGLDSAGLMPGDYTIFREQRWPNDECQVFLVAIGEDATMRILKGIWNTEPLLCVCGDKIPPISRHRNDFIVLGVLDGIIKARLQEMQYPVPEEFDWGC